MTIRFQCEKCKRTLSVDRRHAGAKVKCPDCGQVTRAPEAAQGQPAEEVPPVRFLSKRTSDDEMDMTPMVDITFLLLIFFMVTAAYSLQRSIEVPAPDQREEVAQARTLQELEQDEDYVIIEIDGDNRMFVDDDPVFSEHDLLLRLREQRQGESGSDSKGPSSLLVLAHGECRHAAVVMALDAGNAVGMENVRLATQEEDF